MSAVIVFSLTPDERDIGIFTILNKGKPLRYKVLNGILSDA